MVEYARLVTKLATSAWLINFTNPVSIVTQAVHQETGARVIGICDTPYELFEDAAHALGLPATGCEYDYFGLNHLGWLREIRYRGRAEMHRLWDDEPRLASVYRDPLFEIEGRTLRLLPIG
jgi:6-phospho-beta-glucosidase